MNISAANINSLWGSLLVEELIRNGVDYFCLSPGSRSAPLAIAVANNPRARSFVHFDERGVAFHALGYVRATGKPAAVICTSGTAGANLLPAIVEASSDLLPLILLTADRPPELHDVGANQTIKQVGLFGNFVRWSFNLPCPDKVISLEMPLTTIDFAVHNAMRAPAGPVHLNCMFREPLAPIETGEDFRGYLSGIAGWLDSCEPYSMSLHATPSIDSMSLDKAQRIIEQATNGIIILGHLTNESANREALALAEQLQWPVFADITSGARLGTKDTLVIPFFNLALTSEQSKQELQPDTIIHIGGRVVSKRLMQWLEECPLRNYLQLIDHPVRIDPIHRVTCRIETGITDFCRALSERVEPSSQRDYLTRWKQASDLIDNILERLIGEATIPVEAGIARLLSKEMLQDTGLFLASSMPIRDVDIFAATDGPRLTVAANRGASGIDGTVASAAGFAVGLERPVTLLIGDLALLHDLNSLAILKDNPQPVIVVVINNNGGGIFGHLPISQCGQSFEKFFVTPHGFRFESAAKQFELDYHHASDLSELHAQYSHTVAQKGSSIIEITVDRAENMRFHERLIQEICSALKP